MNAPDLTPGPGVRDAVLRRARVLRLRRQAAWTSAGAACVAVAVITGGAVLQPTAARRPDVVVPATDPATPSATAEETPTPTSTPSPSPYATSASPTPTLSPHPTPTATASPSTTWIGPDDAEPPPPYPDEYLDDHGTRRAYPAAYGTCEYDRDPDVASNFPGLEVTASDARVEGTTVYVTVTIRNGGTTPLQIKEETMTPMDALFQGDRQMTGTGTFVYSNLLVHMLEPGDSVSAVHRLHAATCAHSRGPRAPLPTGEYQVQVAAIVYPGSGGGFGGPFYAAPVTVTLP